MKEKNAQQLYTNINGKKSLMNIEEDTDYQLRKLAKEKGVSRNEMAREIFIRAGEVSEAILIQFFNEHSRGSVS